MSGFDLKGLTASFGGERVIGPLSLNVHEGERVALVGRSGAGKSTLISLIHQQVEGIASLVPQNLGLVNALPVFHNVYMGRLDTNATWYNTLTLIRPFAKDTREVKALLTELAMPEKVWIPAASLSGGQRQRVAIARALYRRSGLLLADEPVSALDGPSAHLVMKLLKDRFATSVIALHDVELALAYCTRIVGIQDGHIALDEPSEKLTPADITPLY
ncbi:ATP-binding cassette domain-containing protein [Marinobacter sp. HL-58]|uniref:ATP-binding cassette domain-containing protein n=1 Tax=Marinobacter sp. HL-58 TaxID=1479237 RepID=UPI0004861A3F|nr:ATP-binding cassette domain-containing protein [Marinobacter sp. HL-58]KPQ01547.1 MAG: ABC-type phosphonate uptake system ATPase component PhnC [Marinobacter sp. HL-58]